MKLKKIVLILGLVVVIVVENFDVVVVWVSLEYYGLFEWL